MAALVTLSQAIEHLRVTDPATFSDVTLKTEQASAIVVDYLKGQADATWTEATAPLVVQAAVLIVLADLHERRPINWDTVALLLMRSRDPALA